MRNESGVFLIMMISILTILLFGLAFKNFVHKQLNLLIDDISAETDDHAIISEVIKEIYHDYPTTILRTTIKDSAVYLFYEKQL